MIKVKVMSKITDIKKEEFKSLTWKYFWQQKIKEVGIFFVVVAGIGVFGLCSHFLGKALVKEGQLYQNICRDYDNDRCLDWCFCSLDLDNKQLENGTRESN